MTEQQIIWTCDVCQELVTGTEGYLTVSDQELNTWQEADERHDARGLAAPDPVQWHVYHFACDPRPEGDGYVITVNHSNTATKLLAWTFQIQEKGWLYATDWQDFLTRRMPIPLNINV